MAFLNVATWASLIGAPLTWVWLGLLPRTDIFCTWCGASAKSLKPEKKQFEQPVWKYSTKHGSRDKRFKDNFQEQSVSSYWRCSECGAFNFFLHERSRHPSVSDKVKAGMVSEDGAGERTAEGFESSEDRKLQRIHIKFGLIAFAFFFFVGWFIYRIFLGLYTDFFLVFLS